jgi:hypothetical protein
MIRSARTGGSCASQLQHLDFIAVFHCSPVVNTSSCDRDTWVVRVLSSKTEPEQNVNQIVEKPAAGWGFLKHSQGRWRIYPTYPAAGNLQLFGYPFNTMQDLVDLLCGSTKLGNFVRRHVIFLRLLK